MDPILEFPFDEHDRLTVSRVDGGDDMVRMRLPYGGVGWLVRRHEHVRAVLSDSRFSRRQTIGQDLPRLTPDFLTEATPLLSLDPPDHTRLRRVGAQAFSARGIARQEPHVRRIVDDVLDRLVEMGPPADLMEHFAWPVAMTVLCQFLGVPVEERSTFGHWVDVSMTSTEYPQHEVRQANADLHGYIDGLVRQCRREPAEDFLTALVRSQDEGRLSADELLGFGFALLAAGYETVATQFGNFLYVLLTNPDRLAELQADPSPMDTAVEELLRFVPAFQTAAVPLVRLATADVEIGGVTVRAGECVFTDIAVADRDLRVFADPEEIDLARPVNPHFTFGHGIHHCIGAPLARLELRIGLTALLQRLPGMKLAVAESELTWRRGSLMRGVHTLPLTW